jgi:hypothetical protein
MKGNQKIICSGESVKLKNKKENNRTPSLQGKGH